MGMRSRWKVQHPNHDESDPYYLLPRQEQVVLFRLRTGHNRLRHHLHTKFRIGDTAQCPCGTGSQTGKHILEECPLHAALRDRYWPNPQLVGPKLYGSLEALQKTVAFMPQTGMSI